MLANQSRKEESAFISIQDVKTGEAANKLDRAQADPAHVSFWLLTLGSTVAVSGDIGASPLYAVRELLVAAIHRDGAAS